MFFRNSGRSFRQVQTGKRRMGTTSESQKYVWDKKGPIEFSKTPAATAKATDPLYGYKDNRNVRDNVVRAIGAVWIAVLTYGIIDGNKKMADAKKEKPVLEEQQQQPSA
eukprot:Colp12_sorted_trinity150504_noHs@11250